VSGCHAGVSDSNRQRQVAKTETATMLFVVVVVGRTMGMNNHKMERNKLQSIVGE
jgi:hypothetical protein